MRMITSRLTPYLFPIMLALALPPFAAAQTFEQIDMPGAMHTLALDINDQRVVVGRYITADTLTHAFVLRDGKFTTLDVPGATTTTANGINARGDIVERYVTPIANGVLVLSGGVSTPINIPGATFVGGARSNARGEVAGVFALADNIRHGFLYDGTLRRIDVPGAVGTQGFAISDSGAIAGHFLTPDGKSHGFILDKQGNFLQLDVPQADTTGAINGVIGINARGEIASYYTGTDKHNHAYHYYRGRYTTFDVKGATDTCFFGINDNGDIVGFYQEATGQQHGFMLRARAR